MSTDGVEFHSSEVNEEEPTNTVLYVGCSHGAQTRRELADNHGKDIERGCLEKCPKQSASKTLLAKSSLPGPQNLKRARSNSQDIPPLHTLSTQAKTLLGIKIQKPKQPSTDVSDSPDLNANFAIEGPGSCDPQCSLSPPPPSPTRSRGLFSFSGTADEGPDRRRRSTLASVSSTVKKMFARKDSTPANQATPTKGGPNPCEGEKKPPILQLTHSNEKYANEGKLRFKNEFTNLEARHDGPSTYWKNEPFWNSQCQLSPNRCLGPEENKTRSQTQTRDEEGKDNERLAAHAPLSPAISIETRDDPESSRPDLTLRRMGSTPCFSLGLVRGSDGSPRHSFDDAVTYNSDSSLVIVNNEPSVDRMG